MTSQKMEKYKPLVLIVDDDFGKRSRIASFIDDKYDVIEAQTGLEGLNYMKNLGSKISLVLLDINMPELRGYEVLSLMNRNGLIDEIPVMVITTDDDALTFQRVYDLGVVDFIGPVVDGNVIQNRVRNTLIMHEKQKTLARVISDQIMEREKYNSMMIAILGHIVEFRNEESGQHVLHVSSITEILLQHLVKKTSRYRLNDDDIARIAMASRLHDIGKIAISEEILNKPGKLTYEEFKEMKKHTTKAAELLDQLYQYRDNPLVQTARDIALWHHERYDGNGYPHHLKGDAIPISAQAMSLADVYDALTSKRAYKEAFSHEKSMEMILSGQCGQFNPLLLECLEEAQDEIREHINDDISLGDINSEVVKIVDEAMQIAEVTIAPEREKKQLNPDDLHSFESQCKAYIQSTSFKEKRFVYKSNPAQITFSKELQAELDLPETLNNPKENEQLLSLLSESQISGIYDALSSTTHDYPILQMPIVLNINGEEQNYELFAVTNLIDEDAEEFSEAFGRIIKRQ